MALLWWSWAGGVIAFVAVGVVVGVAVRGTAGGVLIDTRGLYSLTRIQLSMWTIAILPLVVAVLIARSAQRGVDPLDFTVPPEVLALMGVSVGSATVSTAIKAHKNRARAPYVAAAPDGGARLVQAVLVEEGPSADETVDIAKLQGLLVTVVLVAAYVLLAWHLYSGRGAPVISGPRKITTLPTLDKSFVTLLAISHAGYLGVKLPNRGQASMEGTPRYSMSDRAAELATIQKNAIEARLPPPNARERLRAVRAARATAVTVAAATPAPRAGLTK